MCVSFAFGLFCLLRSFSPLFSPRLLPGLSEKLKDGIRSVSPPSGQFYELRLLFLLTALRPELRRQLRQVNTSRESREYVILFYHALPLTLPVLLPTGAWRVHADGCSGAVFGSSVG